VVGEARIDSDLIDAVIFDLDGVITDTAEVHRVSWERLFNEYLRGRSARTGERFRPFGASDYFEYIDGKPRYDGVHSFLASRDIELPMGTPEDRTYMETICGLGNRKNDLFLEHLKTEGVEPFVTSVDLVRELQRQGVGTALISSSRNVREVLAAADLEDLFPVVVDGVVAEEIGIPGKPDPAVFLEAASRLGARPGRSVVVEDALSGVEAGKRGGFSLVIGVDRTGQADQLVEHGATVTVSDLSEVRVIPPSGGRHGGDEPH
jgi:alpha,alpha-trehalase